MKRFVIANWKSNKSRGEARQWMSDFARLYKPVEGLEVIIAPSMICVQPLSEYVRALELENVSLAAQDVSPFSVGAYTGGVAASMLKGIVDHVIIGHFERRRYFHETTQDVAGKIAGSVSAGLKPVMCVDQPYKMSQLTALNDLDCKDLIIGYGSFEAANSHQPEDPKRVEEVIKFISQIHPQYSVVYGGSVTQDNVTDYASLPGISGVMVGRASLNPEEFANICGKVGANS